VLLTVIGLGLLAVLIDVLTGVLRRPALAGLPFLALFAVPAATVPKGVGILPFVAGGIGYLTLLMAESTERVSRWGRPLGMGWNDGRGEAPVRPERADTAPLAALGRRVGAGALGVALVLPAVIPGLHSGLFGTTGGTGQGGRGHNTVTTYNPITRIHRELVSTANTPLFHYTTNASDPTYFRMTTLDKFTGDAWSQVDLSAPSSHDVNKGIPVAPGLASSVARTTVHTQIVATPNFSVPWLPVPYPATRVTVDGDWRWDDHARAIFSTQETTLNQRWAVTSIVLHPTLRQLEDATPTGPTNVIKDDTTYDRKLVPRDLAGIAASVTKHATSAYDEALVLQDWFRQSFRYTTAVADDGSGAQSIDAFIRDRAGYCVQFASTMALMARSLGIPARVAIGFTRGVPDHVGGYVVTTKHAHAWPELYFDGVGWLPFEPTPRSDGQSQAPAYPQPSSAQGPSNPGNSHPNPEPTPGTPQKPNRGPQPDGGQQGPTAAGSSHHHGSVSALVVLVVLGVVLVAPATGRRLTRRRRWAGAQTSAALAHTAWRELTDDVTDLGIEWPTDDSPRRAAIRLASRGSLDERATEALRRLAHAEELARYAPAGIVDESGLVFRELPGAVRIVRAGLRASVGRGQRFVALVVPRSTVRAVTSTTARWIADALDAVDALVARLRRVVVPRRLRQS